MSYWSTCVGGFRSENSSTIVGSEFVPLVSADYQATEPLGYVLTALSGLLVLFNVGFFLRHYLFRPKQHFICAFVTWSACLFLFQTMLVINRNVNRLQLIVAIFHNTCELYMAYWNYLAIRGYVDSPLDNKPLRPVELGDKIVLWTFSLCAMLLVLGQLTVIALLTDLRYGVVALYLILFGDLFFIGTSIIAFLTYAWRASWLSEPLASFGQRVPLVVAVASHSLYAMTNLLTCSYPVFAGAFAMVTNAICIASVTVCLYSLVQGKNESDAAGNLPSDTFLC